MVTKFLSLDSNRHLLFLLSGQSLSPRAFWDFKLPTGETHADWIFKSGIDVCFFDPVGYGENKEFYQYDRIGYADQIETAIKKITKKYLSKTIVGFSTSTAPALIAAERKLFDKTIIFSPCIRMDKAYYVKHGDKFETSIEKLKRDRLAKISDRLMKQPYRYENWEQSLIEVIGKTEWVVPAKIVYDVTNYWVENNKNGFDHRKISNVFSIVGQYDYEITTGGYSRFKDLFPSLQEYVVPNSSHFSMWEKQAGMPRGQMIKIALQ